jgi:DNA end-binding protein Ku
VTDEEISSVRLESTRTIDIERFVPADEIDRIYWDHPYYLAPDGKLAQEAFAVIRDAMARAGQIALGRVVLATRERLLALEPRGKGIVATSLRSDAEVRKPDEIFSEIGAAKTDPAMIDIAQRIIEQQEGPFDPSQFVDRYEKALKALIAEKRKGHKPVAAQEPEDTNVVDLMSALRASLQGRGGSGGKAPAKTTDKRATASKRRRAG